MLPLWPLAVALTLLLPQQPLPEVRAEPFSVWLNDLIAEARIRGVSENLIQSELVGLEPLPHVVESDRSQEEATLTFARYFSSRVTTQRVRRGRELAREHRTLLTRIERTYGVPRRIVLGIWGIETGYGRNLGRTPVFQALATLAWEPRRAAFFRGQLFDALAMVTRGYIDAGTMTGSWAGAMGQTQFMPSSYLEYAVDFDRDGHRDIWTSTPDALASIASYLKGYGWSDRFTWGREVRVPAAALTRIATSVPMRTEGCRAMRDMTERRPLAEWQRLGVRRLDGGPLPRAAVTAALVRVDDRAFLAYPNYDVLLAYNCAHYYALSVAMLGDRIQ